MAELVTVRAFSTPLEAHLACTVLQSAGLDAAVRDEHLVSMDWFLSNAIGGVKLQVPADQVDVALALLDAPMPDEDPPEATAEDDRCPECGATATASSLRGHRPAILMWFLLGVPLYPVRRRRTCAGCGVSAA